jgi:hypothetical protein
MFTRRQIRQMAALSLFGMGIVVAGHILLIWAFVTKAAAGTSVVGAVSPEGAWQMSIDAGHGRAGENGSMMEAATQRHSSIVVRILITGLLVMLMQAGVGWVIPRA